MQTTGRFGELNFEITSKLLVLDYWCVSMHPFLGYSLLFTPLTIYCNECETLNSK